MAWYDTAWDWTKDAYKGYDKYLWWGLLPGGHKTGGDKTSLPYFEEDRARLQQLMGGGSPYTKATLIGDDPYQAQTDENLQRQRMMASGQGPSLAEQQYRSAQQENVNAQAALARGGRGPQGARFAAQNIGRSQAGLAAGVAEARTREQMGAQSAYNQSLQSAQGAAFNRSSANAQLQQQADMANQRAYLGMLASQLGLSEAELRAKLGSQGQPTDFDRYMQVAGTIGPLIAASDERLKHDVEDADEDIDEMLGSLRAKAYRYNEGISADMTGGMGDGRRLAGILAQDLERSKLGRSLVSETPVGKAVDVRGGLSAALAGMARLDARLRKVEGK